MLNFDPDAMTLKLTIHADVVQREKACVARWIALDGDLDADFVLIPRRGRNVFVRNPFFLNIIPLNKFLKLKKKLIL